MLTQVFCLDESFDLVSKLQGKALEYANGTRVGIKNEVETWYEKGKTRSWRRVKAFVGPAGYGKSVIMAHLAMEGGLATQNRHTPMLSDSRTLSGKRRDETPSITVGAAHFFTQDVDLNSSSHHRSQSAFRSLLCAPLIRVKPPEHPIVVLLDALDEANVDEKEELVEIITTLWESETPQWLGVIVSTRPEAFIQIRFRNNVHVLQPGSEENLADLKRFLRQRLESCIKAEENIAEGVEIAANRCDGLFLYASFLDKLLQEREDQSLTSRDIRTLVKEFPRGLEIVYREYFARFLQHSLKNNYDQYQTLLSSMLAARTPLDVDMVATLLELGNQELEAFLARAENLFVLEDNRIRFLHGSMRGFLQSKRQAGRVVEKNPLLGGKPLSVSADMGHGKLLTILKANPSSPFAKEHLLYHLCQRKDWEGVRAHLLDFDWIHAAISTPGVAKRLIQDTDSLYNYKSFSDMRVTDVIRAIELGKTKIEVDPNSLAFQLLGRIRDCSHPVLTSLAASEFAKTTFGTSFFVPFRATLESARSPLRKVLEGLCGDVRAVAIDGDTVVSSSWDRTVQLWDRRSGECVQVLKGHSFDVCAVAIDGDTVVSGSEDETVRLWDRESGECLQTFYPRAGYILAIAIDGDTVVLGCEDKTVLLWDRVSGECLHVLKDHSGSIQAVAIDGNTVVSGSRDKTVRVWDRRSGECLQLLNGHSDSVEGVDVVGDTVVSGSKDKAVRLWDQRSGECLHLLEGHSQAVISVAMDGDIVVSGSHDCTVRLWGRFSGDCLQVLEGHSGVVRAVAIDGTTVVSGSLDDTVRLWNLRSDERVQATEGHSDFLNAVAMDGDTVVSGSWDKTVRLWSRHSGKCLQVLEGHSNQVTAVAIDAHTVVSGSQDKTVRLWDRRSGECLQVLEGHSGSVEAVAIVEDTVVSGSLDETVRLWNRQSGECCHVLEGHSDFVDAIAIDVDTVVSGSADKTVRLWDRRSGECLHVLEGHCDNVLAVGIDGDTVVSSSEDGDVRLWDRRSGACLIVFEGHENQVTALAIDGDVIVSGSMDKTVRLWDRRSGNCVQVLLFDRCITGVALGKLEESHWMVVSEEVSKIPHSLVPLNTRNVSCQLETKTPGAQNDK